MPVTPTDPAVFQAKQEFLRDKFGQEVTFMIPQTPVYASGSVSGFDPETGLPYDPVIEPESGGGFDAVTKKVTTIFRPVGTRGLETPTNGSAFGLLSTESGVLILNISDYPDVEDATRVRVWGDKFYSITRFEPDGIGSAQRMMVFVQELQ